MHHQLLASFPVGATVNYNENASHEWPDLAYRAGVGTYLSATNEGQTPQNACPRPYREIIETLSTSSAIGSEPAIRIMLLPMVETGCPNDTRKGSKKTTD